MHVCAHVCARGQKTLKDMGQVSRVTRREGDSLGAVLLEGKKPLTSLPPCLALAGAWVSSGYLPFPASCGLILRGYETQVLALLPAVQDTPSLPWAEDYLVLPLSSPSAICSPGPLATSQRGSPGYHVTALLARTPSPWQGLLSLRACLQHGQGTGESGGGNGRVWR